MRAYVITISPCRNLATLATTTLHYTETTATCLLQVQSNAGWDVRDDVKNWSSKRKLCHFVILHLKALFFCLCRHGRGHARDRASHGGSRDDSPKPTDCSRCTLNKFRHDHVFSPGNWVPVHLPLAVHAPFHYEVGESPYDGISAVSFLQAAGPHFTHLLLSV